MSQLAGSTGCGETATPGTKPSLPLLTGTLSLQTLLAIYARDVPGDQNDIILSTVLGAEAIRAGQDG